MQGSKTILVTGAAGFIGSHFLELAHARGYKLFTLDALTYAANPHNLLLVPNVFTEGSIVDAEEVEHLLAETKPDYIVNFAAESHVDTSIISPGIFLETNVIGTFNLLNKALSYWHRCSIEKRAAFRFIQVSTDEVFGSISTGCFTEDSPFKPNSPYSASKAAADCFARAWHETYGFPVITTHCTNNYGSRQNTEKLIPKMIKHCLEGERLPIHGSGENVRDWIHVKDHVRGILNAMELGTPGSSYLFGGDEERTNLEVVTSIAMIMDDFSPRADSYLNQITHVRDRPGNDLRYAVDSSLAQSELNWKPAYTFGRGLRETVRWYVDRYIEAKEEEESELREDE